MRFCAAGMSQISNKNLKRFCTINADFKLCQQVTSWRGKAKKPFDHGSFLEYFSKFLERFYIRNTCNKFLKISC